MPDLADSQSVRAPWGPSSPIGTKPLLSNRQTPPDRQAPIWSDTMCHSTHECRRTALVWWFPYHWYYCYARWPRTEHSSMDQLACTIGLRWAGTVRPRILPTELPAIIKIFISYDFILLYKKKIFSKRERRHTWSRNAKLAKLGKFLAHLTAMNRSLALVS